MQCTDCQEIQPMRQFMNYSNSARSFYDRRCRLCRITRKAKQCPQCQQERRIIAFVPTPRHNHYQDTLCRLCRNAITRAWNEDRFVIEGFTNVKPKGSHPQVQCNDCLLILDRRHVNSHRCPPTTQ